METVVFKAINACIKKHIGTRTPWRTRFGLVSGDEDGSEDTFFAPLIWPLKSNTKDLVGYRLWETVDTNLYWLSNALGVRGGALCLEFLMEGRPGGPSKLKVKERLVDFSAKNTAVREAGFVYNERGSLMLPFKLDATLVASEYPDLKKSLAPLEAALETLLKVNPEFDVLVKEFLPSAVEVKK